MQRHFRFALLAGTVVVDALGSAAAIGQSYPTKPIRLIIGYEPGGGADNVARLLAAPISDVLGQQIVVDNRSGANGVVAAELVARSPHDGYTVHVVTSSHVTNPAVYPKLSYDTAKDFTAVSELADAPLVMVVHPSMKASNVAEFIEIAKAKPGELVYASAGLGNMTQVAAELFSLMVGIKMIHVPYKGSGPAIIDLIGGRTTVYFPPIPSAFPHVQSGKLKALAVTGSKRSKRRRGDAPRLGRVRRSARVDRPVGAPGGHRGQRACEGVFRARRRADGSAEYRVSRPHPSPGALGRRARCACPHCSRAGECHQRRPRARCDLARVNVASHRGPSPMLNPIALETLFDELELDHDWLTGFFLALVVGPELVEPSKWIDELVTAESFSSLKAAQAGLELLMRLYNTIADASANPGALCPALDDGEAVASFCEGYVRGAQMQDAWKADDEGAAQLFPFVALSGAVPDEALVGQDGLPIEDVEAWRRPMREKLVEHVAALTSYWAVRQAPVTVARVGPKVGRNDPCPCGRGKKFKRCCMDANA